MIQLNQKLLIKLGRVTTGDNRSSCHSLLLPVFTTIATGGHIYFSPGQSLGFSLLAQSASLRWRMPSDAVAEVSSIEIEIIDLRMSRDYWHVFSRIRAQTTPVFDDGYMV